MTSVGQQRLPNTSNGCAGAIEERLSPGAQKGDKCSVPRRRNGKGSSKAAAVAAPKRPTVSRSNSSIPLGDNVSDVAKFFVRNQLGLSVALLSLLPTIHTLVPSARPIVDKFVYLSNRVPETGNYLKSTDDLYFVFTWIIMFTLLRITCIDYVFQPYARMRGIAGAKDLLRFAEQAWIMVYYSFFWSFGTWLYYNSPYFLNMNEMWAGWPYRESSGEFKWYYLVQMAFWLQQIFVLHIEQRRKDHYQMLTHHIVTCCLIASSYISDLTRIGNVILCLMDFVDILLPAAKLLKYLGHTTLCDFAFIIFLICWIITRHLFYPAVVYSIYRDGSNLPYGCWSSTTNTFTPAADLPGGIHNMVQAMSPYTDLVCWDKPIQWTFIGMLVFLQLILLVWGYMIVRVAARVIRGGKADDIRSDGEDDELDEPVNQEEEVADVLRNGKNKNKTLKPRS